jgi:hypothetical protein
MKSSRQKQEVELKPKRTFETNAEAVALTHPPLPLDTWVEIPSGEIGTIDHVSRDNGGWVYNVLVGRCCRYEIHHAGIRALPVCPY